ncbi:hypothetical protein [Ramlibacter sp. Leaf400]|uniref:hypothetical protein n=1 Tax=Ramlibacter sp. Leaf400 TaxID=1736365 RepID=UPI0012E3C8E9|nr:hypothetical protein [Ramlibacter sp. Leaf400]
MRKLLRYGPPYRASCGAIKRDYILIEAAHPARFYENYTYFGLHTTSSRTARRFRQPEDHRCLEVLVRERRAVLFFDAAELQPIYRRKAKLKFCERLLDIVYLEKCSLCVSSTGAEFLLNESYSHVEPDQRLALVAAGFVIADLPIRLSPYCGGHDACGGLPATRGYLITRKENVGELDHIVERLKVAEKSAPDWDDASGVRDD